MKKHKLIINLGRFQKEIDWHEKSLRQLEGYFPEFSYSILKKDGRFYDMYLTHLECLYMMEIEKANTLLELKAYDAYKKELLVLDACNKDIWNLKTA